MKKTQRLIELDFMRAVSALWVILIHLWLFNLLPSALKFTPPKNGVFGINMGRPLELGFEQFFPLPLTNFGNFIFDLLNIFCGLGYQAVHVFFVLSGFGLAYSKFFKPNESWLIFLKNRFLRIYPTYFVVLSLLILINIIKPIRAWYYISWKGIFFLIESVPYTWFMFPLVQLYIAFPILFYLLKRYSVLHFLITMFLVKFLGSLLVVTHWYHVSWIRLPFEPGLLGGISRVFEFSLGMAAAKVFFEDNEKLVKYLTNPKIIGLAAVCEVVGTLIIFLRIDIFNERFPIGLAICDALIGFGIFVIVFNFSRWLRTLNPNISKIILFISKFSYEMYLCQFIGLLFVEKFLAKYLNLDSPSLVMLLTLPIYSLAVVIDIFASFIVQKITSFLTSRLSRAFRALV